MILASHRDLHWVSGLIFILTLTLLHRSENEVSQHLASLLTDSLCSLRYLRLCYFCALWFRSSERLQLDLWACLHGSFCTVDPLGIQSRRRAGCVLHQFSKSSEHFGPSLFSTYIKGTENHKYVSTLRGAKPKK